MVNIFYELFLLAICPLLALVICYVFFENKFNYILSFTAFFMLVFIGLGVVDYSYLALVVLIIALVLYLAIQPKFSKNGGGE